MVGHKVLRFKALVLLYYLIHSRTTSYNHRTNNDLSIYDMFSWKQQLRSDSRAQQFAVLHGQRDGEDEGEGEVDVEGE